MLLLLGEQRLDGVEELGGVAHLIGSHYEGISFVYRLLGAKVEPAVATSYRGVQLERGAAVVLDPSFAPCLSLLRPKLPTAEQAQL